MTAKIRFSVALISALIFLFPSCSQLVNGDVGETVSEHYSKENSSSNSYTTPIYVNRYDSYDAYLSNEYIYEFVTLYTSSYATVSDLLSYFNSTTYTAVYDSSGYKYSSYDVLSSYTSYYVATEWVSTLIDAKSAGNVRELTIRDTEKSSSSSDWDLFYITSGTKYYCTVNAEAGYSYDIYFAFASNSTLLSYYPEIGEAEITQYRPDGDLYYDDSAIKEMDRSCIDTDIATGTYVLELNPTSSGEVGFYVQRTAE